MKANANLNGQDILNFLLTPETVEFTEKGNPIIKPLLEVPENLSTVSFNYVTSNRPEYDKWVHFYINDFLFNRVWNNPTKYLQILKKYPGVFSPDFSLFRDTPYPIQMFNHYRRQWCGVYWQANGITVIPNVRWSDEKSYEWCFDGVPKHSVISVSAIGSMKEPTARYLFYKGYEKALEVLEPKLVLLRAPEKYQDELIAMTGPVHLLSYDFYNNYGKIKNSIIENS